METSEISAGSGNFTSPLEIIVDSGNSGDGNFGNLRRVRKLHLANGRGLNSRMCTSGGLRE
jgi:hypothetical protein